MTKKEAPKKQFKLPAHLVELGRQYGTDEADRRGEKGKKREERIKRAIGYQLFLYERDMEDAAK